jgi:hypothetical protein
VLDLAIKKGRPLEHHELADLAALELSGVSGSSPRLPLMAVAGLAALELSAIEGGGSAPEGLGRLSPDGAATREANPLYNGPSGRWTGSHMHL